MGAKILAFAGSLRAGSFNKTLVKLGVHAARNAGAEVTLIDLKEYPLPLYDGDLEDSLGLPENGRKLKDLFLAHQGLLLACPEYNSSISAVLKNTIDWVSRPVPGERPLGCFEGKVAGLMSASPGAFGGMRGLTVVRLAAGKHQCAGAAGTGDGGQGGRSIRWRRLFKGREAIGGRGGNGEALGGGGGKVAGGVVVGRE